MVLLDDCDEEDVVVVVVVLEDDNVAADGLGMMQQALSSSLPNRSDDWNVDDEDSKDDCIVDGIRYVIDDGIVEY